MSALQILLAKVLGAIAIAACAVFWWNHTISTAEQRGYDRAVEDGRKALDVERARADAAEDTLRNRLAEKDRIAKEKEDEHKTQLEDAQRRARAGRDRLYCPAAGPIPATTPATGGQAAGGFVPDERGAPIVPEMAAEILGDAAAGASIVRKYDRLVERFEACRTIANTGQAPAQ